MADRTWTIYDIDGTNPREVTLAEYKAEIAKASAAAMAKFRADVAATPRRRP